MAHSSIIALPPHARKAASSFAAEKATAASKKHSTVRPPLSDRAERTSFSSIHENSAGVAQSFTDSKTSSYLRNELVRRDAEEAIIDDEAGTPVAEKEDQDSFMLNPHSALHGLVCPCDNFKGWKGISISGKIASRSFGDLRLLAKGWEWDSKAPSKLQRPGIGGKKNGRCLPGQSPFERLPNELLSTIIDQLATDIPPNGFTARNVDLMALLRTSRSIHSATLGTLYAQITIPHSRIFAKFLHHVTAYPALGTIVRRLDFSHFNPTGAGMTQRERLATLNLIPATLLRCLDLTPNLREFLAQEHIDDDLDATVLKKLFCDLPKLRSLDLCACSSTGFATSLTQLLDATPEILPAVLPIRRLSLHECTILPASTFTTLLPKLTELTHLDVAHTRITDAALACIPATARLTHLNLSRCASLTGSAVVDFIINHPAAQSLVYLNLSMDVKSAELLSSSDLSTLLPALRDRSGLRALNLKGSKMDGSHLDSLLPLTKHVEELGLGRHLRLSLIERLFVPDENGPLDEQLAWTPHQLRYVDMSDLSAGELDLGSLFSSSCPILRSISSPLEVLELSPDVHKRLAASAPAVTRAGWVVKEFGRRFWLVRLLSRDSDGARNWKMGATYWGLRKVPVAVAEVGGMYGHYMFKR